MNSEDQMIQARVIDTMKRNGTLAEQVAQRLRTGIRNGRFGEDKLPEERKLAEDLDVSRGTLRSALTIIEKEGLITRMRSRGTLIQRDAATGTQRKVKRIGIVYKYAAELIDQGRISSLQIYSEIFNGAVGRTAKEGWDLMVLSASGEPEVGGIMQRIEDVTVDGLVLLAMTDEEQLTRLDALGIPMVLVDHKTDAIEIDSVNPDSFGGARQAVEHLVDLGHRTIGYINWWKTHLNMERLEGYRTGLRAAGLAYREEWVQPCQADPTGGYEAMKRLLDADRIPTAVFCYCDSMAFGAIRAIEEHGLSVPRDISIIGCGDERKAGERGLTSIGVEERRIGCAAVEQLIKRIDKPNMDMEDVVVESHLVKRDSCAPPPAKREK